ncbi:MAG: helix-turn-helix transcriptional regulator [Acidimicrobiaceae bacterium]|nr:helix-turn-helix transcriptional regulator [Acidimicrobiaceae bacterium]
MIEAYEFGAAEGPHRKPWKAEYLRESVNVYDLSLPRSYQRDIAALFRRGAEVMRGLPVPVGLDEDWLIVDEYLTEASLAIALWLPSGGLEPSRAGPGRSPGIGARTPTVIRFDQLARLTTREGTERLSRAAHAVQQHLSLPTLQVLGDDEQRLLRKVASGASIVEVAAELGYSERSIYRALSKLWHKLGVTGRVQGIRKAAAEGLLD